MRPAIDFTHTRLLVSDYEACFEFYRDILGFEVARGDVESGYADLETGETTLAIFTREWMAEAIGDDRPPDATDGADAVAVIFQVPSVDEAYDDLNAAVTFVTEPHDQPTWGIRVAHLRDPSGTLIELNEPLEGA